MYVDDSMLCDVGHVLLVTDVERSPLPSLLRDVLAKRLNVPDDQMMNIAGQPLSPHADFRLVLSSSVPLSVRGIYATALLLLLPLPIPVATVRARKSLPSSVQAATSLVTF